MSSNWMMKKRKKNLRMRMKMTYYGKNSSLMKRTRRKNCWNLMNY